MALSFDETPVYMKTEKKTCVFSKVLYLMHLHLLEAAMYGTASRVQSLKGDTFITVAGSPVELSHSIKSLGVTIHENLTFDKHVRNVCKASLEQPCQRIPLAQWLQQ